MDEFTIIQSIVKAEFLYQKIKASREEIEQNHPKRKDLISSMNEAEDIAKNSVTVLRRIYEEFRVRDIAYCDMRFQVNTLLKENYDIRQENERIKSNLTL
jgi:redox-regulated HSP33 family molecular chaperone